MINSPFDKRRDEEPHNGGLLQLEAHVAKINNYRWVRDTGRLYFIAKRDRADGTPEHLVDRQI